MTYSPVVLKTLISFIILLAPGFIFSQSLSIIKQSIGINQNTRSIKAVNSSNVWLCGTSGVFNTSDGGSSWQLRLSGSYDVIEAIDNNIAFSVNNSFGGIIHRTSDFGVTWTPVHGESTYINSVKMFDALNGIAIGDPIDSVWRVLRTTDSGLTWNLSPGSPRISKCEAGNINAVAIAGSKFAWFGTSGCGGHKIYKSIDGGLTWTSFTTQFDDTYGIWFNDSTCGVVAIAYGFYNTNDGGENWNSNNKIKSTTLNVCGTSGGEFWGTSDSSIFSSTDAGLTWTEVYRDSSNGLGHSSFVNVNGTRYGWVACGNGTVIKYSKTSTGVRQEPYSLLSDFVLQQNYPNPFNPKTTIPFLLSKRANVSVRIYNIEGQLITTLLDEDLSTGFHSISWDASMQSSGTYVCVVKVDGMSKAINLILIK